MDSVSPVTTTNGTKRPAQHGRNPKPKRAKLQKTAARFEGTHDDVLAADVASLQAALPPNSSDSLTPPAPFTELEVTIQTLSSTGDGLGISSLSPFIIVVPFTLPGDVARAKIIRQVPGPTSYIQADFLSITTPSPARNDSLVRCPYFSRCAGCQFQMLDYPAQLAHKRDIVTKAFRNFSGLPAEAVPAVGETIGSPLQYGYRTKLTPHFDGPRNARRAKRSGEAPVWEEVPAIGFMQKGRRTTLDIEECPIGTEAVQMGLRRERKRVVQELDKYRQGATILLRESTECLSNTDAPSHPAGLDEAAQTVYEDRGAYTHAKTCVTDHRSGVSTEYIDDYIFRNSANAFFQNNNSILGPFTEYIRRHILRAPTSAPSAADEPQIKYLIDAYSGSGLFTITLSSLFERSIGIDIDPASIAAARTNARLNGLLSPPPTDAGTDAEATTDAAPAPTSTGRVNFLAADASALFASVADFPAAQTAVVLDPPRKGCDEAFLTQLLAFAPARIVYVSCNVHTQARDIGWLLRGGAEVGDVGAAVAASPYEMESLVGFDFFPQTGHVEGVAVLRRKVGAGVAAAAADAAASSVPELAVA